MILNVDFHGVYRHAESEEEKSALIAEVMETLKSEGTVMIDGKPWPTNGSLAYFSLSNSRHSPAPGGPYPDNYLVAAVNRSTGYGALVWFVIPGFPRSGGIYDSAWVSDNPEPPDFDPRVVSDPDVALVHEPANTLPLARIREALEEFVRTGTGDRPKSIKWVPSSLVGQRVEA